MTAIVDVFMFLEQVLFRNPETRGHSRARSYLLLALFLIGIVHWVGFFNAGDLSLVAYDWVLEVAYLNTLREAQTSGVIPWRWSIPYYHGTQNFLANPEIILTPDIVLLYWLPNGIFITVHVLLLYAVGFYGTLLVARRLNASFLAFLIFWLVFNFNGYVTAHLAAGHFPWTGYFLLPFFFIFLFTFVTQSQNTNSVSTTSALSMALLFGVLFLNGSFHIVVWCSMFMAIALLWRWAMFPNVFTAILVGGLLGAGRILPAALSFPEKGSFISGYPDFGTVLDAFTSLRGHDSVHFGGMFGALGWWEYDIYVGFIAFIALVICFALALKRRKAVCQKPLVAAAAVLFLLSLGDVYALVTNAPFPFAGVERVSSRFIVMPFMLFLIIAMAGSDELFCSWPKGSKVAALMGLPFVAWELALHSFYWRVDRLDQSFQQTTRPALSLVPNSDPTYAFSVYAGWSVSLITLVVVVTVLFWNRQAFTRMINRIHLDL
jgi:hypothetical protein